MTLHRRPAAMPRQPGAVRVEHAWRPLLCLLLGLLGCLPGEAWPADETALKSAIVYNLLQFIQWPADMEAWPAGSALGLCADRQGPLWPPLQALQGRALRQWKLEVRETPANPSDLARQCQVLVLEPRRGGPALGGLPAKVAVGRPVLTVGDAERSEEEGVVVGLNQFNGRIVFDVDLVAARANHLQISAKVLRLARAVRE
jgi:hypothetical protein